MKYDMMDEYYDYLEKRVDLLMKYTQIEFLKTKYFRDNKKYIVEKYNLTQYFDDIYIIKEYTIEECLICNDTKFDKYVKCGNNHIICFDCFGLCKNKKTCCICTEQYDIKKMYHVKETI